jgi:hypothetical protein
MNSDNHTSGARSSAYTWGIVLIALGVLFLLGQMTPWFGNLIGAGIFVAMGIGFYALYQRNDSHWGLLIPSYVMFALAGLVVIDTLPIRGDLGGAYVMFAIAAPFFYVYFRDRSKWWALIPGGIMAALGVGILLSDFAYVFPAALIVAGIYLLVRQFGGRGAAQPQTGPAADKPVKSFEPISGPEADHPQD